MHVANPRCHPSTPPTRLLRASLHCLAAALVLKTPACAAWKQLWCSKAAAGQPALLGSNFGAQRPLPAASPPLESRFGAQRPLQAASPHRSALLGGSFGAQRPAAGCQPAPLGSSFGAQRPLQAASPHRLEAALVLKRRCGLPARTAPHRLEAALVLKGRCGLPARTAPHCLEAALVLKGHCRRLPACTACR